MHITNKYEIKYLIKHNIVRIPTGGKQTSWLFTKLGGIEFQTIINKTH